MKYWYIKEQQNHQLQQENIAIQLNSLKAQVHPHFLFNTLNNIYSFSVTCPPKTPPLILKLSSLLRYMLYDCKAEQVLLSKELEVMRDYADLERERYGNKIEISWNTTGDIEGKYIAPLMLLPFLENAFKHGTSEQLEKPWLSFNLSVQQNLMKCKVVNSKNDVVPENKHGIGIENIKKRLAYLYPGKHELKINDDGGYFVVSLLLDLGSSANKEAFPLLAPKIVIENSAV
jgi:LytS/YehU family sensor histidine kinase